MGARAFYFVLYILFYLSLCLYQNKLRDAFLFAEGGIIANIVYILYYFGVSGAAIYYFLTAGENPGFVDETETEDARRMRELKVKMTTSESSEDADDTINMGLDTSSPEIIKDRQDLSTSLARGSKLKSFLSLRSASKETYETSDSEETQRKEEVKDPESGIEFVAKVDMPEKRFCQVCNIE